MKTKEAYVGQEVAMASTPRTRLGAIVAIRNKMADVKVGDTTHVAVYGIKALVEYIIPYSHSKRIALQVSWSPGINE